MEIDPQKLVPAQKKKKPQNKTPQKLTSFTQIKNSAFNKLVPLRQYTLNSNKNIKVPLRRKFLVLFSPFSYSNPFNEFIIAKIAIN